MILNTGASVSIAGISWMIQYLEEFDLKIEDMKSGSCNPPFVFGPSRRYVSELLVELLILVTRLDGKKDVLTHREKSSTAEHNDVSYRVKHNEKHSVNTL